MNHKIFKPIAILILFFFSWSFLGICDIAYAVKNSQQSLVKSQSAEKQKPEEKFEKTLNNIEQILIDPATDTDTKKNKLKTKKTEIESHDVEIKKQFAETEKKLKDEGLPNEILVRHSKFVKHYEDNLKELKNNLDAIDKAKTKNEIETEIEKTKKFLRR